MGRCVSRLLAEVQNPKQIFGAMPSDAIVFIFIFKKKMLLDSFKKKKKARKKEQLMAH